jgi:hypothetical protein
VWKSIIQIKIHHYPWFRIGESAFIRVPMRAAHPQNLSNPQKWLSQNHKTTKKASCKYQKTSSLKNTFKILLQKVCESGFVVYFCTRNDAQVLINTGKLNEIKRKFIFKKRLKKFARNKNECYICTPLNEQ